MQEKESIVVFWCKLKTPSLRLTVKIVNCQDSYPRDGIFNTHLTTNKDSYNSAS